AAGVPTLLSSMCRRIRTPTWRYQPATGDSLPASTRTPGRHRSRLTAERSSGEARGPEHRASTLQAARSRADAHRPAPSPTSTRCRGIGHYPGARRRVKETARARPLEAERLRRRRDDRPGRLGERSSAGAAAARVGVARGAVAHTAHDALADGGQSEEG